MKYVNYIILITYSFLMMFKTAKLLKSENLKINFKRQYDVVENWNNKIKESIDRVWNDVYKIYINQKMAINPKLFNGSKFRLHSFSFAEEKNELTLNLSLTDYKSFIGTYYNDEIKNELESLGKEKFSINI